MRSALYNLGIDHLAVPVFNLFIYAVIAGLFCVLAAMFPSIRASRINVLQAIATE
jgi:ABC-type antimicrobial peptide transport system permease subunit